MNNKTDQCQNCIHNECCIFLWELKDGKRYELDDYWINDVGVNCGHFIENKTIKQL